VNTERDEIDSSLSSFIRPPRFPQGHLITTEKRRATGENSVVSLGMMKVSAEAVSREKVGFKIKMAFEGRLCWSVRTPARAFFSAGPWPGFVLKQLTNSLATKGEAPESCPGA